MRICLAGSVRNCASYLPGLFAEISEQKDIFDEFHFIFAENDSSDGSAELLASFAREFQCGQALLLPSLEERFPQRTDRIGYTRQLCLDEARKLNWTREDDYFILIDCDDVTNGLSLQKIRDVIVRSTFEWHALFANTEGAYYDLFALRHPVWCPNDPLQELEQRPSFMSWDDAHRLYIRSRRITISPDQAPIPVISAFGGIGIYKLNALASASYAPSQVNDYETCEHIWLHETMRQSGHGKLFIHPELMVHPKTKRLTRIQRLKRSINKRLRKTVRS